MTVKRLGAVWALLCALVFAGTFAAQSAVAAPYARVVNCSLNVSSAPEGSQVVLHCTGFLGNRTITIVLHSKTYGLGTADTDSAGEFTKTLTLPDGVLGDHSITATDERNGDNDSVPINIYASGTNGANTGTGSGSGNGSSGGSSGLASTGVAVIALGVLGVGLVAGGGVLMYTGRRRRVAA